METPSGSTVEDKKPEVKTEPKEEEGANSTPANTQSKKKGGHKTNPCTFIHTLNTPSALLGYHFHIYVNVPSSILCCLSSVFKPDELRQALMPTLEALYRQDPESLPFRQPVDPQLLGIPVRIRTSNKTNLVRACADTHYATNNLALFSFSLISLLPLFPSLSSVCCCLYVC